MAPTATAAIAPPTLSTRSRAPPTAPFFATAVGELVGVPLLPAPCFEAVVVVGAGVAALEPPAVLAAPAETALVEEGYCEA